MARVFTTLNDAYDPVMLFSYTISFLLSSILLLQLILYRRLTKQALSDNNKKKKTQ